MRLAVKAATAVWALLLILQASAGFTNAPALPDLENLSYRVDLPVGHDSVKVNLTLKQMGPYRYLGQATGAVGRSSLLGRWFPVHCETEMIYRQGRLQPLVYREQFRSKGKQVSKEFHFDYGAGQLILQRRVEGRPPDKEWRTPLKGPIYDPLTLCYNLRLGALGPLLPGKTWNLAGIPYPKPNEITLSITTDREVLVTFKDNTGSAGKVPPIYLSLDGQQVPTQAWTRMPFLGKITGQLVGTKRQNGDLGASLGGAERHSR